MKRWVIALLLLLSPASAATPVPPALYDLYARGRYEDAIRAGEAAHSAVGYALAARAAMADALLRDAPCLDCLKRAEALARQAVAADPNLADGQTWLAASLGYQARIIGLIRARLRGLPGDAQAALQAAVAAEPDNAYAAAALGGWNIEVVKAGGPWLARSLYGATREAGLEKFDRAVALAPGNVAVRYQIALSLAGFDPVAQRARVTAELDAALRAVPATAYERSLQARAAQLKTAMAGSRVALDALVRKYQGYP
jgi:hypothetical protein